MNTQFNETLGRSICDLNLLSSGIEGIDIHRRILLQKRLSMAKKHLAKTAIRLGDRFASLHFTYATQFWPKADAELFDDVIDFVVWLNGLNQADILKAVEQSEVNWLRFQNGHKKISIHFVLIEKKNRKKWAIQFLSRFNNGSCEQFFFF